MVRAFTTILILLVANTSFAQFTLRYTNQNGVVVQSTTSRFTSDFGRRNHSGTRWHQGVDYQPTYCTGAGIVTLASGRVVSLSSGYKVLTIEGGSWTWQPTAGTYFFYGNTNHFGYGHLFNDNPIGSGIQSGNFVFLRINGSDDDYAILNLTTGIAIGPIENAEVTYNGTNYIVRRRVETDQLIAPMGDSGGSFPCHLHLYMFQNPNATSLITSDNCKNPLALLNYPYTGNDFEVLIEGHDPTNNNGLHNLTPVGGSTYYPGNVRSAVIVKDRLRNEGNTTTYNSTIKDTDKVNLFIKRSFESNSSYRLIQGGALESKIWYGGTRNGQIYPTAQNPSGGNADITNNTSLYDGSITRTGIEPFAYSDPSTNPARPRPFDLHYFSDIYTRIHKNHVLGQPLSFAPIGKLARYPDGKYNLLAEVITIKNVGYRNSNNPQKSIIIDNFRPYVEKVEVFNEGLNYSAEWEVNTAETALTKKIGGNQQPLFICNHTILRVKFSEPMQACTLKVGNKILQATNQSTQETWDRLVWEYSIPILDLPTENTQITITGTDMAGNQLRGLPSGFESTSETIPLSQFVRGTNGFPSTTLPTSETSYWLFLSNSKNNPDCDTNYDPPPISDFSYKHNSGNLNQVNFTNKSTNATHFLWDFGNGQTSTQSNPGTVYYTTGTYTESYSVSLKAFNADGNHHTSTKTVVIPGQQGTGGINLDGYHISLGGDQYEFHGIATGAFRYNFTFFMGDGEQRSYTNSTGWPSFYYTYSKPSTGTYYTPTLLVQGFDENGYMVGEHYIQLFQIFVDKVDIGQLNINISVVSPTTAPTIDTPFRLKASCSNYQEILYWQWVVYNTKVPNDNSMQCNTQTGCRVFWGNSPNSFTTPQLTLSQPGKYLTQLTVWGGDYSRVINYEIEVFSGSTCILPIIYAGSQITTVQKQSTLSFESYSYIVGGAYEANNCTNQNSNQYGYYDPKYKGPAILEWRKNGSELIRLQKCFDGGTNYYEKVLTAELCNNTINAPNHGVTGAVNYTFPNAGVYSISLKAIAGIGWSIGFLNPTNPPVSNTVTLKINVIDCNSSLTLRTFSDISNNQANNLVSKGNIIIEPASTITLHNTLDKKIIFEAYNSIILKPGFTVKGNDVRFKIKPCPPLTTGLEILPERDFDKLVSFNGVETYDQKFQLYPNPNTGNFVVELSEENDLITRVEVISITGNLIDQRLNVNNFYSELDLSNEADGVYIVRVFTKNGEVYSSRVIKQR